MAKLGNNGLPRLLTKISDWVNGKFNNLSTVATSGSYNDLSNKPTNYVTTDTTQTIDGTKTFNSQIKGTIDKSKDYYLSDNTLASTNGSLGTVKYYPATNTADLDTEIFEHSLWAAQKVFNSIPTALDSFYYIDQYFYSQRTATSNRIQILRGYRNASLQMVRVYNSQTNSWSEWKKFADDSDVVHKSGDETVAGNKTFSGNTKFAASATIEKSGGDVELLIKNTAVDATSVSANTLDDIRFVDSNNKITGAMRISYDTSNGVTAMMYARSYSADGSVSSTNGISITSNQQTGAARATISANLLPNSTNTYDLGSSALQWNNAYIKSLTINGVAAGDILTHNASEFVPVSDLSTVATSGSYNDLSNKPTIPTVNNATLTIQKNGTTVKTFTANASSNVTCNITVPTNTNELTNGAGFVTSNHTHSEYDAMTNAEIDAILADVFENNNNS